jgi:hypothetical protein
MKLPTVRITDFLITTWNYFEILLPTIYFTLHSLTLFTTGMLQFQLALNSKVQHPTHILLARSDLAYLSVTAATVVIGRLTTLCQTDECKMLTIGKETEATHCFCWSPIDAIFRLYAQGILS